MQRLYNCSLHYLLFYRTWTQFLESTWQSQPFVTSVTGYLMSSVGLHVHKTQCGKTYMETKDIHTLTYAYIHVNMYVNICIRCVCIILKSETGGCTDDSAFRDIWSSSRGMKLVPSTQLRQFTTTCNSVWSEVIIWLPQASIWSWHINTHIHIHFKKPKQVFVNEWA